MPCARADERGSTGLVRFLLRNEWVTEQEEKIMLRWIPLGAATLLALAPACQKPAETKTAEAVAGAAERISDDDKEFMTKAAQGSMLEVALGQRVAAKTTDPDVKALGSRTADDHARAHAELKEIATNKGLMLPAQLEEDRQEELDEMTKLSGTKLDAEYADEVVEAHEKQVKQFREAVRDVKDPELRAWAEKTLPMLEQHLEHARQIKAKVGAED